VRSPSSFGQRLRDKVRSAGYASPLYAFTLKGPTPPGLNLAPEDIWPGDPDRGNALFQGRFAFAGHEVRALNEAPWLVEPPSQTWNEELHAFEWLRHFSACGVVTAADRSRELVRAWILQSGDWAEVSWRPDVLGRRLGAWLCHAGFLLDGADENFRQGFLASLAAQARHLARSAAEAPEGAPRLAAAVGLVLSALALPGSGKRRERGLQLLERELGLQVLADGGHVSRNPCRQVEVLRDLVLVRNTMAAAGADAPDALPRAIATMSPMVRFFRHGDGRLALFNGGREASAELLDVTLARADAPDPAPAEAPHAGYQRLGAGGTVAIVDCGPPPPHALSGHAHAGTLGFELGIGRERLIVNCGAAPAAESEWGPVMRSTAAHSTLVIADTNSSELRADGLIGRRPGAVAHARSESNGSIWLEASHDGYLEPFALDHRRRFYLDASGEDFRGEDSLTGPGLERGDPLAVAVRFHLHPSVRASLVRNGDGALLRLPSGDGWRLRAVGGAVSLEESVYYGTGQARRAEQIVVSSGLDGQPFTVKWRLSRVHTES
jgi:uncharacterized heparinase superfamily protein